MPFQKIERLLYRVRAATNASYGSAQCAEVRRRICLRAIVVLSTDGALGSARSRIAARDAVAALDGARLWLMLPDSACDAMVLAFIGLIIACDRKGTLDVSSRYRDKLGACAVDNRTATADDGYRTWGTFDRRMSATGRCIRSSRGGDARKLTGTADVGVVPPDGCVTQTARGQREPLEH